MTPRTSSFADALLRLLLAAAVGFSALLLMSAVSGCSMQVDKGEKKEEPRRVEIDTPFGSLKVRTQDVDPKEIGLPVYGNARRKPRTEKDAESANITIDAAGFGLKVVAIAYESDDAPANVIGFYRKEMAGMGKVVECQGDLDFEPDEPEKEMRCKPDRDEPDKVELGVRVDKGNRVVSVQPRGRGSEFNLIFIAARGKREPI